MRKIKRLPLEQLEPLLLAVPEPPARLDWAVVFGNDHPVEIEVGFGKGLFLVTAASAQPETNFLGVEIMRKYQLYAATRLVKRGLTNVRLCKADARLLFRDAIESESVAAIHVYFPDPWWKKRHHKRRVFTPEFIRECARILQPGGKLLVATDVADYHTIICELVEQNHSFQTIPPPEPHEPRHDMDYLTNFERKFRQEGRTIYRMAWKRVAASENNSGSNAATTRR